MYGHQLLLSIQREHTNRIYIETNLSVVLLFKLKKLERLQMK